MQYPLTKRQRTAFAISSRLWSDERGQRTVGRLHRHRGLLLVAASDAPIRADMVNEFGRRSHAGDERPL
jgi:hypothetical protein